MLGVGWIAVSISLLKVYNTALERHALSNQIKMMELEKAAEEEYVQRQKMNELTLRKIMHDLKNQLMNVHSIMVDNPVQGAQYLSAVIDSLQSGPKMEITTDYHNVVINQILNKTRSTCARLGIELSLKIEYDNFKFLGFLDASAILDNAFDNAVTACNQIHDGRKKYIELEIFRQENMLIIIMKNSRTTAVIAGEETLISSKAGNQNHGFGISSIKTAAKHYEGIVTIETPPGEFVLFVALNVNKQ